jgi:hypothetical protein
VIEIRFDCARGYAQCLGDLGVFATLQEQLQNPVFTGIDLDSVLARRDCQPRLHFYAPQEIVRPTKCANHVQWLLGVPTVSRNRTIPASEKLLFRWKKRAKLLEAIPVHFGKRFQSLERLFGNRTFTRSAAGELANKRLKLVISADEASSVDDAIIPNSGMCGRYRLSRRKQIIEEFFETAPVE